MRPISQTLDDMVVDPNNVELDGDLIAKTLGEDCEHREKQLKTAGEMQNQGKDKTIHEQPVPQTAKGAGEQQPEQEPNNSTKLPHRKQQVSMETAKEGVEQPKQGTFKNAAPQSGKQ